MKLAATGITQVQQNNVTLAQGQQVVNIAEADFMQYAMTDPHSGGGDFVYFDGKDAVSGDPLEIMVHEGGMNVTPKTGKPGNVALLISADTMHKTMKRLHAMAQTRPAPATIEMS